MEKLEVLSMNSIQMMLFPPSFDYLKNLRTLCFDDCQLNDISTKNLEILSFCGCKLEELPKDIGKLTNLRLLDLTNCSPLRLVPSSVICGLPSLKGVYKVLQ